MESAMLKRLKERSPDKVFPSNIGQKWTEEEEALLLGELRKGMAIDLIAQKHSRSVGGIDARRKGIAYEMYKNSVPMDEIINKTKLHYDAINEFIAKKEGLPKKTTKVTPQPLPRPPQLSIEREINEMKRDIKELKASINELVEMMKAVYEFEEEAQ